MRLLHTSDWHLGRQFHGHSLLADQRHMLEQLVAYATALRPDLVVVAGDIYDRAVPPPEAVDLLNEVLTRLVIGLQLPVVLIAGNHDSGERLGFGARLLQRAGLHIAGPAAHPVTAVPINTAAGRVCVYPLPYAEPGAVRARFAQADALGHGAAMQLSVQEVLRQHPADCMAVLVAHAFVVGGETSESERPLSVGGSGAIDASVFAGFDYVALGHLHRPQTLGGGRLRYAGSPLKYSQSEVTHAKSFSLVQLAVGSLPVIEALPVIPLHDLHVLTGTLAEVCAPRPEVASHDFVLARLTDPGALLDPMAALRRTYPNALGIERLVLQGSGTPGARGARREQTSPEGLYASFFEEVTGTPLQADQQAVLLEELDRLRYGSAGQDLPGRAR